MAPPASRRHGSVEARHMERIGRDWSRFQWVGAQGRPEPQPFDETVARWNLYQWVGDRGDRFAPRTWPLDAPDSRGGFSGFAVPDSGGQRWATGYGRAEGHTIVSIGELEQVA